MGQPKRWAGIVRVLIVMPVAVAACTNNPRHRAILDYATELEEWSQQVHAFLDAQQEQLEYANHALSGVCELAFISPAECPVMIAGFVPLAEPPRLPLDEYGADQALALWAEAYSVWSAEVNDHVADLENNTDAFFIGSSVLCETIQGEDAECPGVPAGRGLPSLRAPVYPQP